MSLWPHQPHAEPLQFVKASATLQLCAGVSSNDVCDQTGHYSARSPAGNSSMSLYHAFWNRELVAHTREPDSHLTSARFSSSTHMQNFSFLFLRHHNVININVCSELMQQLLLFWKSYDLIWHACSSNRRRRRRICICRAWRYVYRGPCPPASRVIRGAGNSWNAKSRTIPMHAWPFSEARFRFDSRMTQWKKNNSNTSTHSVAGNQTLLSDVKFLMHKFQVRLAENC